MIDQAFSIHGHFYQPPREDPLTGEIPLEPGAAPYHNWNERIHAQCYRPNALNGNFEKISFNIGPTLIEWMVDFDPGTLARIVDQDNRNYSTHGVGNAMAQPYNHTILPLASRDDKLTQVLWGIYAFEYYFGHKPLGMWLPEAAVDMDTLQVLAENGIEHTILAPWQADVKDDDLLDISRPYLVPLSKDKQITVFFYHQDLSGRISFDPSLSVDADRFVSQSLMPLYKSSALPLLASQTPQLSDEPQIILIASDGELYGHHQPFRDQFLSRLVDRRGALHGFQLEATYPALWLKKHPAEEMITIRERTSWSCYHGVTRWMGDCDCTPHGEWKAPLREAMDKIAELVDAEYLKVLKPYLDDVWQLRHAYIHVLHKRLKLSELLLSKLGRQVSSSEAQRIDLLLQAQFERQRMFTSCGWFFDDFDRIEPRNNVAYTASAIWLTYKATGVDLSPIAMEYLGKVRSWRSGMWASTVFRHYLQNVSSNKLLT